MRLRTPGAIDAAIETLRSLESECELVTHGWHQWHEQQREYLNWVERAHDQYRNLFTDDDLAGGLYSPLYWEIRRLTPNSANHFPLIAREVGRQLGLLLELVASLRKLKEFVARPGEIVVPDTSALVRGELFTDFDWPTCLDLKPCVRLIIPILVVEELDKLKDSERATKAGDKARRVLKVLRELCRTVESGVPASVRNGATVEVLLDEGWHRRLPIPDAEIIDQALNIESLTGKKVTLVCVDAAMEFRARQFGLTVQQMPTSEEVRQTPAP
jgi:hypothetical protein